MSEEHFRVIYYGPAVEDGEMEVAQFAPSLLALGKLLELVDAVAHGEAGRVRVKVKADVRRGSFDIGVALDFVHAVKAWLLSPDGTALASLAGLTGITAGSGLIQLVRWLRGRKVKAKVMLEDGNVRIELDDGDVLVVAAPVARIADDSGVRQQLERFTQPLRSDGVREIRFATDQGSGEVLRETEAASFEAVSGTEPTSQARFVATYQIKRLYFERGKKWRLSNGAQTILAEIEDEGFWQRVEAAAVASLRTIICVARSGWINGSARPACAPSTWWSVLPSTFRRRSSRPCRAALRRAVYARKPSRLGAGGL